MQLNTLLKQYPGIGSDLIYSKNFTDNVRSLIYDLTMPLAHEAVDSEPDYLAPLVDMPEGWRFAADFAKESEIKYRLLQGWMDSGKLGEKIHKFCKQESFSKGYYALSPEQQEMAIKLNEENNERLTSLVEKPEGYVFTNDYAKILGVGRTTLNRWLTSGKLGGEIKSYHNPNSRNTKLSLALSPEQQEAAIRLKKEAEGDVVGLLEKPEGYTFATDFARTNEIRGSTLVLWLTFGKLEGESRKYRNPTSFDESSYALSPEQQEKAIELKREFDENVARFSEKPEGYLFLSDFAEDSGIGRQRLEGWIRSNRLNSEVEKFRNSNSPNGFSYAFSLEQQEVAMTLKKEKDDSMANFPEKPAGYEFITSFAKSSGIRKSYLTNWLTSNRLGGEIKRSRSEGTSTISAYVLSPEQQEKAIELKREFDEYVASLPEKPEEYEFASDFARRFDVNGRTMRDWFASGKFDTDVRKFRHTTSPTGDAYALSPEQQVRLMELKKQDDERKAPYANLPERPEGYEFFTNFSKRLEGVSKALLLYWMKSGKFGEVKRFRSLGSSDGSAYALSPEQQAEAFRLKSEKGM